MACNVLLMEEKCVDISAGPHIVEVTSEDTDFVAGAKAELYNGNRLLEEYTVGSGITISDYNGNDRRLEVSLDNISKAYLNRVLTLNIRPSADLTDVIEAPLKIIDNHAKR